MNGTVVFTSIMEKDNGELFLTQQATYTTIQWFMETVRKYNIFCYSSHHDNAWQFSNDFVTGMFVFDEQPTRQPTQLWSLETVLEGKDRVSIKMITNPYPAQEQTKEEDQW